MIIYYSDKCKFCAQLLIAIKSANLSNLKLVNIDFQIYPKDLVSSVPTLIGEDIIKPLVGKEVFQWVNNQRFFNSSSNNINLSKK
jgi:hypothetical protein